MYILEASNRGIIAMNALKNIHDVDYLFNSYLSHSLLYHLWIL